MGRGSQRRKEGSAWRLAMREKARRGRRALPIKGFFVSE